VVVTGLRGDRFLSIMLVLDVGQAQRNIEALFKGQSNSRSVLESSKPTGGLPQFKKKGIITAVRDPGRKTRTRT